MNVIKLAQTAKDVQFGVEIGFEIKFKKETRLSVSFLTLQVPVKSSSALSSTSSSGRWCFCSIKRLAALRDVKISSSCTFIDLFLNAALQVIYIFFNLQFKSKK